MKVLIGALGIGNRSKASKQGGGYDGVRYVFEDGHREDADIFLHALAQHQRPDLVLVLVTKDAKEMSWEYLKEWLDDAGIASRAIDIPTGQNRAEAWEIFNTVVRTYNAMFPDDTTKPEVVIDITLGLRSIPVLMLSVARYLQQARDINLTGVYYGAHDSVPRENYEKPVYKLDSFLTLLDLASAVDMFHATGKSFRLAEMLHQTAEELRIPNAEEIINALHEVSLALDLVRTEQILQASHYLVKMIEGALTGRIPSESKPILDLLTRVGESFEPLALADPRRNVKYLLRAMLALVNWYADRNRYSDAILLARETFVTWSMTREQHYSIDDYFDYQEREKFPRKHELLRPHKLLWEEIQVARNDLAHAGMSNTRSADSSALQARINNIVVELRKLQSAL